MISDRAASLAVVSVNYVAYSGGAKLAVSHVIRKDSTMLS